ncbi:MAG: collagen-binding domain-containing protein [Ruminococcus sp.]|nr:collagen-binding domain-containing protein [Ruminococcus sp.]
MKKLLSSLLAATMSVSIFCLPVNAYTAHVNEGDTLNFNGATSANAFGELLNWTGVVFGNANNIIDVEGTLAVGGNFTSTRSFSLNSGANGANPASTEDVAFLVNGNADISGNGSVMGQTVIGTAEGNTYRLSNVTPSGTTNGQYTVANTAKYFEDAKKTAYDAKAAIEALPVNGVCEAAYGVYNFVGNPDAKTLVYNVDESNINSYLFDFNIADGQTVVVNLTSPDTINFKYGACRINGDMTQDTLRSYNRNIILNVVNSTEITMTSGELYGILLAPDANLNGDNANVCGTTVVNGLTGTGGFELHVGFNNNFTPAISDPTPDPTPEPTVDPTPDPTVDPTPDPTVEPATQPGEDPAEGEKVNIRIDAPLKMAVAFGDGTVYYGGEMKEVIVGKEYIFQMCSVNWDNGLFDDNGNGIRGTVVYRMIAVHQKDFNELADKAKEDPERYTVKGIDIIDNVEKKIIVNCDAKDTHLETDVNNFFMAYRFHFENGDYNKKTGIDKVINKPLESLSVNLPLGSTIACKAYKGEELVDSADVFIENNSGKGIYYDVHLTSVNDYTWGQQTATPAK